METTEVKAMRKKAGPQCNQCRVHLNNVEWDAVAKTYRELAIPPNPKRDRKYLFCMIELIVALIGLAILIILGYFCQ